jgi:hypothetical protein
VSPVDIQIVLRIMQHVDYLWYAADLLCVKP